MPQRDAPHADRVPVSVVILTLNEERNLGACLDCLADWVDEIHIVDSGSSDATLSIATSHGASVWPHPFIGHADQWRWALANVPLRNEWVLGLDADQRVSENLRRSLTAAVLSSPPQVVGYHLPRRQIFRGTWIRHGGYYPVYLLKLFRKSRVYLDPHELVDHRFYVDGETGILRGDLVEDNANEADLGFWLRKHLDYAPRQAETEFRRRNRRAAQTQTARFAGSPDARRAWLRARWQALPLYVRPFLYFAYRYVLHAGFLDGRQGFIFHVMQGFWYRLLVDIYLGDLLRNHHTGAASIERTTLPESESA